MKNHNISVPISVNIEAFQLVDHEFIDWLIKEVDEHNIPDDMIELEITENTALFEDNEYDSVFVKLRDNKIKVAIDDFTMGATSLSYLQNNKFDFVKLDGGIVRKLLKNARAREIIISIIELGKTVKFEVIAEYVETNEQKKMLDDMGCYLYQGYLYSPAISIEEFIKYVEKINQSNVNEKSIENTF